MTGRIKSLSPGSACGFITAENGLSIYFDSSAVLAYDITCLAVGQLVTFDIEGESWRRASNVCVRRQHQVSPESEKHGPGTHLRYRGFEQAGNVRSYQFDRISPGEDTTTFVVTADMALFLKHHVGLQDGPALCLHLLTAELGAMGPAAWPLLHCWVTDRDMLAHLASRPVAGTRRRPKRKVHRQVAAAGR